jgi:hypothetical protein
MIHALPFGNPGGFGEGKRSDEHYYAQGMKRSQYGVSTGYGMSVTKDSDSLPGLANIKFFADVNGKQYAQGDNGDIYAEANNGAADFALVRDPTHTSNGAGLIGDQKGRLLYFGNTDIGMYNGSWTDAWKTGLFSWSHQPDLYEDLVVFGNGPQVGVLYSDDSINTAVLTLPSSMFVSCLKAGKHGILVGANIGSVGYLILWNPNAADRAAAPWIPLSGQVQSIERTDDGWVVVTQKQILWTNGYSTEQMFPLVDDPLGFAQYTVAAQGTLRINDKLFILNQASGYLRLKGGVYILDLKTKLFEFVPLSTMNVVSVTPLAIAASKFSSQNIVVGYRDDNFAKNYIATLGVNAGTRAVFISEPVADGPGTKAAEAVILNLMPNLQNRGKAAMTFSVSVKLYTFDRPLWGIHIANATAAAADLIRVDGTSSSMFRAQVGDEITILEGANAGQIRHIASIANEGLSNETWTLDSALAGATVSGVDIQVEPYRLIEKKTFANVTEIPELYFNAKNRPRGKRFLIKIVIESLANVQLELQPSTFVYDDLGPTT